MQRAKGFESDEGGDRLVCTVVGEGAFEHRLRQVRKGARSLAGVG